MKRAAQALLFIAFCVFIRIAWCNQTGPAEERWSSDEIYRALRRRSLSMKGTMSGGGSLHLGSRPLKSTSSLSSRAELCSADTSRKGTTCDEQIGIIRLVNNPLCTFVFEVETNTASTSAFFGLGEPGWTRDPGSRLNTIGIGYSERSRRYDNWLFYHRDGVGWSQWWDLGSSCQRGSGTKFSFSIDCNYSDVGYAALECPSNPSPGKDCSLTSLGPGCTIRVVNLTTDILCLETTLNNELPVRTSSLAFDLGVDSLHSGVSQQMSVFSFECRTRPSGRP